MGKKSNKSKMRKQIAIIFVCGLISSIFTGCGIKGSLYQTPTQQTQTDNELSNQNSKDQQEK